MNIIEEPLTESINFGALNIGDTFIAVDYGNDEFLGIKTSAETIIYKYFEDVDRIGWSPSSFDENRFVTPIRSNITIWRD